MPRLARLKERACERSRAPLAGQQRRLLQPRREAAALRRREGQRLLARLPGRPLHPRRRGRRRHQGLPVAADGELRGRRIRERSLRDIWNDTPELAYTRTRTVDDLWGFCRTCAFAETCMAGCTFTAHGLFGRPGNNVYCHYRAKHHADLGLRERLVPKVRPPGRPFDGGLFDIVVEPFDAPDPSPPRGARSLKVWTG